MTWTGAEAKAKDSSNQVNPSTPRVFQAGQLVLGLLQGCRAPPPAPQAQSILQYTVHSSASGRSTRAWGQDSEGGAVEVWGEAYQLPSSAQCRAEGRSLQLDTLWE